MNIFVTRQVYNAPHAIKFIAAILSTITTFWAKDCFGQENIWVKVFVFVFNEDLRKKIGSENNSEHDFWSKMIFGQNIYF